MTKDLNYLVGTQNADGGWALVPGEASQVFYTALALQALNTLRLQFVLSASQNSALTFLRHQHSPTEGGYGSPSSTAFETAQALLAILGAGLPLTPAEASAIDFLTSTQQANGSWANDAYSTALALRALAFFRRIRTGTACRMTLRLPTGSTRVTRLMRSWTTTGMG